MDSKDDISHDAIDPDCYTEEEEEINTDHDYYNFSSPDHNNLDHDDDDWDDVAVDVNVTNYSRANGKSYTILNEQDIRKRQEKNISEISNVLQVSKEAACLLLIHYKWSVSRVHEEWFSDEEKVRNAVGIVMDTVKVNFSEDKEISCGVCFEEYACKNLRSAGCGHLFCDSCWEGYVSMAINDGPGCLTIRCPDPSCAAAVGPNMVDILVGNEDKAKYYNFLCRSYVENSTIKWCPAPGCDSAVEFVTDSESYDVICACSYEFCWDCKEEIHRPVDCETVGKWNTKNSVESESSTWIMVKTKPCPKCKKPIEKNQGCNVMTCRPPCRFRFCWLCLDPITCHGRGQGDGGPGSWCNAYGDGKQANVIDESKRLMIKKDVEKYNHYYERWVSNSYSRRKALKDLNSLKNVHLQKLTKVQSTTELQLKFILEAWEQIVECRRVLKWSYAYGYYLSGMKLRLFQHLQGEAESGLERLHHCAETELIKYIKTNKPSDDFHGFRTKLVDLTKVTRNYFDNLVRALENDLSEVKVRKRQANNTEGSSHKLSKPR